MNVAEVLSTLAVQSLQDRGNLSAACWRRLPHFGRHRRRRCLLLDPHHPVPSLLLLGRHLHAAIGATGLCWLWWLT